MGPYGSIWAHMCPGWAHKVRETILKIQIVLKKSVHVFLLPGPSPKFKQIRIKPRPILPTCALPPATAPSAYGKGWVAVLRGFLYLFGSDRVNKNVRNYLGSKQVGINEFRLET